MTTTDERPPPARTLQDLGRPRTDWEDGAACKGHETELFTEARFRAEAKRLCGTCPVRWDCFLNSLRHPTDVAVRGAMSSRERRLWLKEEGIDQPPAFDWPRIKAMVDAGARWADIGAIYGVSGDTMNSRWIRYNDRLTHSLATRGPKPAPIDLDRVRQLRARGWTFKRIAEEIGVNANSLRRVWRKTQAQVTS